MAVYGCDPAYAIGVPVLLCALLAAVLGSTGLNVPLFLALQSALNALPGVFWANVTLLGDALVTLALLGMLAHRFPQAAWNGLVGGLFTTLVTRTFKPWLEAERPLAWLGDQVQVTGIPLHTFSFPSGHTVAIFLLAGTGALVWQRSRLTALLFLAAGTVGLSRVAVGAHWPMDVCAGASIGWGGAWVGWKLAAQRAWLSSRTARYVLAAFFLLCSLLLFVLDTGYPQARVLQYLIATLSTVSSLLLLWKSWRNTT